MFARRSLMVLALTLAVVRCADQPTGVQPSPTLRFVRWAGNSAPLLIGTRQFPSGAENGIFRTAAIVLDRYSLSFWAVRGEPRPVQINYLDAASSTAEPFLLLTSTDPEFVPGVGELALGDSVFVTITVDSMTLGVSFDPPGITFHTDAEMKIYYGGAGDDLTGDGTVDPTDTYVETSLLGVWNQQDTVATWTEISSTQSLQEKSFTTPLTQPTKYALSYRDWVVSW